MFYNCNNIWLQKIFQFGASINIKNIQSSSIGWMDYYIHCSYTFSSAQRNSLLLENYPKILLVSKLPRVVIFRISRADKTIIESVLFIV